MTKYLALDLGDATIGMAESSTGLFATNCGTLRSPNKSKKELIKLLSNYLTSHHYDVIIIGNPKHMNGDEGIRSDYSKEFKNYLETNFPNLKVVLWDERLSTKSAYSVIKDLSKKETFRKTMKDELAAEIILQNYLDSL